MIRINSYLRLLLFASAIAFFTGFPSLSMEEVKNESLESLPLEWNSRQSHDFSGEGRPKRTAGGASRSQCQNDSDFSLTALIPDTPVALTATNSPTFWFYIPYTLTPKHSLEFVIKDSQDKYIYKTKLAGKETSSGIIGLRLPSKIILNAEENYSWYFLVYCQPQNSHKFVYVNGSIRRIEYDPNHLKLFSAEEKLQFYVTEGLWHDVITYLVESMISDPQDVVIRNNWVTLLQSVGLKQLANKPFVVLSQKVKKIE